MTRDPNQTQIGQDALIVAHPESGELLARDFDNLGAVNLVEHRLHLLNALSLFGAINQREMFYSYQQGVAETRYGENAPRVLEGSKRNRDEMVAEARDEFYRAIGFFAVQETVDQYPDFDLQDYQKSANRDWTIFQASFRSANRSSRRRAAMKQLREGLNLQVSEENRNEGKRPYISATGQRKAIQRETREYSVLGSRQRLEALRDDPRAGFLPKTDKEKIKCFTFLDYLDNPEYPLGVTNQFIEVFVHKQKQFKTGKIQAAQEAVTSITHEMHDHWLDSVRSLDTLRDLEQYIDGISPTVPLLEELPAGHPSIPVLIRYRDLARYRDKGVLPQGISNPLRVVEDRRPHDDPTKNKTTEDIYTGTLATNEMQAYIDDQAKSLSVRQARLLMKAALKDEQAREQFWSDRMEDLAVTRASRALPMSRLAARLIAQTNITRAS